MKTGEAGGSPWTCCKPRLQHFRVLVLKINAGGGKAPSRHLHILDAPSQVESYSTDAVPFPDAELNTNKQKLLARLG